MSKKSKEELFVVKLRFKSNNPTVKIKPPFVEGLVVGNSLKEAEQRALDEFNSELVQNDAYAEVMRSVKLKQQFFLKTGK